MNERPIIVTAHAVARYRTRHFRDERDDQILEEEIRALVADAFANGRYANHKPKAFRLYGERYRQLPAGERFVWDGDPRVGFIVARKATGEDVVTTTLKATGGIR